MPDSPASVQLRAVRVPVRTGAIDDDDSAGVLYLRFPQPLSSRLTLLRRISGRCRVLFLFFSNDALLRSTCPTFFIVLSRGILRTLARRRAAEDIRRGVIPSSQLCRVVYMLPFSFSTITF